MPCVWRFRWLPGPMIRETVQIARAAKELYPDNTGHARRLASVAAAGPDARGRSLSTSW